MYNFWKKVFKPIARVVTIIVAVFVPPVAAIITTVVKVSSGPKKLYILKNNNGDYKNASNQYSNN